MTYKATAIEALLASDPSGRLRSLHDRLLALGLKTRMVSNSDTLLFEAITPSRARVGIAPIRGGNTEVISFPRGYWVRHTAELEREISHIHPRHTVEIEGFVSQSQFSLRQIRISQDTAIDLVSVVDILVRRHALSIQAHC